MSVSLQGNVLLNGEPLAGARVRLLGDEKQLGGDPNAAAQTLTAITWTRSISGFSGSIWNGWLKFVARDVAGLTWQEFREEVVQYNPSLGEGDGRFEASQSYLLPENKLWDDTDGEEFAVVWDRELRRFPGDRWACWKRYVRGKVVGMGWTAFKEQVVERNPILTEDGFRFVADKRYVLPRSPGIARYARVCFTGADGRYRFDGLEPGEYELEVFCPGYPPLQTQAWLQADRSLDLELEEPVVRALEDNWVRVKGERFVLNGQTLRFIGVNMRDLVYYGTPLCPGSDDKDQQRMLAAAHDMGARVVRIFLPHKDAKPPHDVPTLFGRLLATMKQFPDMYLIVAFTNIFADTPNHLAGDEAANYYSYRETWQGRDFYMLNAAWFAQGYKQHYLPFVRNIVGQFCKDYQIFAWEIGNELKSGENRPLLIPFMHHVAREIRAVERAKLGQGPYHLITTGLMGLSNAFIHAVERGLTLYGSGLLDFITIHSYNEEDFPADVQVAKILKKPFIVEEAGFDRNRPNRAQLLEQHLAKWFGQGASGYMQWAFWADHRQHCDGDTDRGGQPGLPEWEQMHATYARWSRSPTILAV